MTTATAHPDPEDIMAWSDRELDDNQAGRVRAHVDACEACGAVAADFRALRARTGRWSVDPAPASIHAGVQAVLAPHRSRPHRRASGMPDRGWWRRYRWAVAAAALVVAILAGTEFSICGQAVCLAAGNQTTSPALPGAGRNVATGAAADFATAWWRRPRVDLGIPADGATVVIAWFVDYECPACQVTDPIYLSAFEQAAEAHPGRVKVVVEDWPWNTDCNPNVSGTIPGHEASCAAAIAVRLARTHGTEAAMREWLFSHQGGATVAEVRTAGSDIGRIPDFDGRYPSELAALRARLTALAQAGIRVTPNGFVNGVSIVDERGARLAPKDVTRAIELELKGR